MASFRKPRKNFRVRLVDSEEEAEAEAMEAEASAARKLEAERRAEKKAEKKKQKSLLSFQEDLNQDDGEVFQVKKSVQSRKLARQLEKERKKKKGGDVLCIPPPPPLITHSNKIPIVQEANGSRQKEGAEEILAMGVDEMVWEEPEDEDEEDEEEEEKEVEKERRGQPHGSHAFNHPDSFRRILQSGEIPDAAMIHAARKRRQMAREMGCPGDYVPLKSGEEGGGVGAEGEGGGDGIGGEEEEDEDAMSDEGQRITFADVDLRRKERERRREVFLAAQEGSESHPEEEDEEDWECQQIRKAGLSGAQLPLTGADQLGVAGGGLMPPGMQDRSSHMQALHLQTTSIAPPSFTPLGSSAKAVHMTVEGMHHHLQARLASLQEVHRRHQQERQSAREELETCHRELESSTAEGPSMARRFAFYQELRGYVTDLVECLDEKVPAMEAAEERMTSLLEERNRRLIQRRRQDVQDQVDEFTPLRRMTSGLPPTEVSLPSSEVDARTSRAAEREGRRTRRRRVREEQLVQSHQDGLSSDDEETDAQVAAFASEKSRLREEAAGVLADVEEDFGSVEAVAAHFEAWQGEGEREAEVYRQAYVSLCLPRLLAPLARVQALCWNPLLEEGHQELEALGWYRSLLLYGLRAGESEEVLAADPDRLLVPRLVLRVAIPRLVQLVRRCWDPCSRSQGLRLVRLVRRLVREVPLVSAGTAAGAGSLGELLRAVTQRLGESADADAFVLLLPRMALEKSHRARAFCQRLFWSGAKLLGNALAWQGLLSDPLLRELALGALLNRSLLVSLRANPNPVEALSGAAGLVAYLPRAWLPPHCSPAPPPGTPPAHSLQPLLAYLQGLQAQPQLQEPPHRDQLAALLRTLEGSAPL